MAPEPLIVRSREHFWVDRFSVALVCCLLALWGGLAFAVPVDNWDSHVYNLGRLAVAEKAGFWQAWAWNSNRQIFFPWTFDSVHYLFLKIGWGFAVPSFLCFCGLLVIVYCLVAGHFDRRSACWSVLSLFAMPTIMLQATSTKNDLVIAFGVASWVYSLVRLARNRNQVFLFTAALSIAFTLGSKTSAIPICGILVVVSAWVLRRNRRELRTFFAWLIPLTLLFGSLETYILAWKVFGNPLGPRYFLHDHANREGIRGAIANLLRYVFGNISMGVDGPQFHSGLSNWSENACRAVLHRFRLDDVGYRPDFNDASLRFVKDGSDAGSDYGLIGFLGMVCSALSLCRVRFRNVLARLSAAAFVGLALNSFLVAWMPWNARFLILSFVLFGVCLTLVVFAGRSKLILLRIVLGVLIVSSAVAAPFLSRDRRPINIEMAILQRERMMFAQRPNLRQVYDDVAALRQTHKATWYLVAGTNSWDLPFLVMDDQPWILRPTHKQLMTPTLTLEPEDLHGMNEAFVLILNKELPPAFAGEVLQSYPENSHLLRMAR